MVGIFAGEHHGGEAVAQAIVPAAEVAVDSRSNAIRSMVAGTIESRGTLVGNPRRGDGRLPRQHVEGRDGGRSSMPRPVLALPCGSRSTISTRSPTAASAVPRLIAVVVLPTPPFWLASAMHARAAWAEARSWRVRLRALAKDR